VFSPLQHAHSGHKADCDRAGITSLLSRILHLWLEPRVPESVRDCQIAAGSACTCVVLCQNRHAFDARL
jgi:hypothetical protein